MLKIVQENQGDYLEFLKKLVSIDSQPGDEKNVAEFLLEEFKQVGVDEAFIDGAGNVIAVIRGEGRGPNVMLNGHMDIVPAGSLENWGDFDPFTPVVKDGELYGRGIADMKGGLGAQIYAFKAIMERVVKRGKKLPGDLTFVGVVQEEPATMFGIEYVFDHTMQEHNLKCDVVYIGEPTGTDLIIGQRGKVELVIKTYGCCAHSSAPQEGVNALEMMVPVLEDIFSHTGIELRTDALGWPTPITVTNCIVRPGGTLSVIPDECELSVDRRYAPGQTLEDLLSEFEAIFKRLSTRFPEFKASVEPRSFEAKSWTGYAKRVKKFHPAWEIDKDSDLVQKTVNALHSVGQSPTYQYCAAGTDGGTTCALHGIPTMMYSGPEPSWAHQPKERASVEKLVASYEGYIAILAALYGLDTALFD